VQSNNYPQFCVIQYLQLKLRPITTTNAQLCAHSSDRGKWKPILLHYLEEKPWSRRRTCSPCSGGQQQSHYQQSVSSNGTRSFERTVHSVVPPRVDYALTPLGRTLLPLLERDVPLGQAHPALERKPALSCWPEYSAVGSLAGSSLASEIAGPEDSCKSLLANLMAGEEDVVNIIRGSRILLVFCKY